MNVGKEGKEYRYHALAHLNGYSANIFSGINPWIPLWWSAAFPGYGHLLLGNTLTGFVLVCFEFVVNNMAHINQAIFYSMIGNIEGAKKTLNLHWFFGYIGVYIFAMYDSYRMTVENNKIYLLSYRYTQKVAFASLSVMNRNIIERTKPSVALFWSFITPGLGSVFTHRLPTFVFALTWWGVTVVKSHLFDGIYYSAIGDIARATSVLEPQWLLFIPSIVGFSTYYGYYETVVANKQFALSQAQYLREAYQSDKFIKPV